MIAKVDLSSNGVPYAVKGELCVVIKKKARHTEFSRETRNDQKKKIYSFKVSNELVPLYFKPKE